MRKYASQLAQMVLYESKYRMELDSLYNEVIVGMAKQEWYQLCSYVWDKRFQFMFIDTTKPFSEMYMYHKCFNPLEITTKQDEEMRSLK